MFCRWLPLLLLLPHKWLMLLLLLPFFLPHFQSLFFSGGVPCWHLHDNAKIQPFVKNVIFDMFFVIFDIENRKILRNFISVHKFSWKQIQYNIDYRTPILNNTAIVKCAITNNGTHTRNKECFVLCLNSIIAQRAPKAPPINETKSNTSSGTRQPLHSARCLSKP